MKIVERKLCMYSEGRVKGWVRDRNGEITENRITIKAYSSNKYTFLNLLFTFLKKGTKFVSFSMPIWENCLHEFVQSCCLMQCSRQLEKRKTSGWRPEHCRSYPVCSMSRSQWTISARLCLFPEPQSEIVCEAIMKCYTNLQTAHDWLSVWQNKIKQHMIGQLFDKSQHVIGQVFDKSKSARDWLNALQK